MGDGLFVRGAGVDKRNTTTNAKFHKINKKIEIKK
jgi:hypothetical protein